MSNRQSGVSTGARRTGEAFAKQPDWPDSSQEKNLTVGAVDFQALAHVLANTCRWGGRTRRFYSFAQHAVLASEETEALGGPEKDSRRLALCALLLDAGAFWLGDAQGSVLEVSRQSEKARRARQAIDRAVREAAGLTDTGLAPEEAELLRFVKRMLEAAERRDFPDADVRLDAGMAFPPIRRRVRPVEPAKAARLWLARLHSLAGPFPEKNGSAVEADGPERSAQSLNDGGSDDDVGRDAA